MSASGTLVPAPEREWPEVEIRREVRPAAPSTPLHLDDDHGRFTLVTGGELLLDRREGVATYRTPVPLDDEELIHPYLAPTGAIFARWHGRQAMHAGAFLVDGRAWGVSGARGAGKSTLLARLHGAGHAILADDVLVIEGENCHAGPRAIDLREGSVAHLDVVEAPARVRDETRWRVSLPPVAPEAPMAGWVFLEWGDDMAIESTSAEERLALLASQRMGQRLGEDPGGLLHLAGLPAFRLRRPGRWDSMDEAIDRLVELASR